MSIFRLFLIFVKIGAILLGGGYVILPIIQHEFTDKRQLISNDDMVNYYAISQSLPGIVAANMAIFIGYRLKGKTGALAAMFGIVFVPFWTIVFLATILNRLVSNIYMQALLWGVGIAVISLILLTAREIWQKSKRDLFFYILFLSALIALLVFKVSPINTIFLFSVLGILLKVFERKTRRDK